MPTTRPRHLITETEDIAAAIDASIAHFPGMSRADVLRHLVLTGAKSIDDAEEARRARVRAYAGAFSGLYPPNHLQELRDEWPE